MGPGIGPLLRHARWFQKCLWSGRHSPKKGQLRLQEISLAPRRRVRAWGGGRTPEIQVCLSWRSRHECWFLGIHVRRPRRFDLLLKFDRFAILMSFDWFLRLISVKKRTILVRLKEKKFKKLKTIKITDVWWFYKHFKIMILRFLEFPLFCLPPVYILLTHKILIV